MPERRAWLIRGRVQGVGFRWWSARLANRIGVAGTVRNCADGAVELMCAGSAETMAGFEREIRRGPPMARVDGLESIPCTLPSEISGFTILE